MKKRLPFLAVVAVLLVGFGAAAPLLPATSSSVAQAAPNFAAPAFQNVWTRTDLLVDLGATQRSYLWGPVALADVHETYQDAPLHTRQVQYFDKTRMEINNPNADPNSASYVTNGLLVVEMISGNEQLGDTSFKYIGPASNVPVAGDPLAGNPNAPTYASFASHASLGPASYATTRASTAIGSSVTATLDKAGNVGSTSAFNSDPGAKIAFYDQNLGHNIPAALYNYLNQTGLVQNPNGTTAVTKVFDWYAAMGFPITEAYWTKAVVAGQVKDVLVQAFQRRILTYTPSNPAAFQVEMGNVGQHYLRWRYPNGNPSDHVPVPLAKVPHLEVGINAHLYYQDKNQVTSWLNDLNVHWVREQITWKDLEGPAGVYNWGELDNIVNALHNNGDHIILSPVGAPDFYAPNGGMPDDASHFGDFMYALAAHFKGKVDSYEIWNEENLAKEAGKPISINKYAQMLKQGYTAVKRADADAIVILGALTPTGVNDVNVAIDDVSYLRQLYNYNNGELKNYYDVVGAHPGSNNNPPNTLWPSNPGPGTGPAGYGDPCVAAKTCWQQDPSFYFRRIEQLRAVMEQSGEGSKQLWLTEFGWDSTTTPPPGYDYAALIDEQTQANYIQQAFQQAKNNYPWMGVMALWQLNFALPSVTVNANDEKVGWGILNRDGSKRPSYYVVQQFAQNNP